MTCVYLFAALHETLHGDIFFHYVHIDQKLKKHKHGFVFAEPVKTVDLGYLDYSQVIKRPMDLGTVKSMLDNSGVCTCVLACTCKNMSMECFQMSQNERHVCTAYA